MFKDSDYEFNWADIGNIEEGRPNLGPSTPVVMYRLLQYTLRAALVKEFGPERTNELLRTAGELAGRNFCKNMLDLKLDFNPFIGQLQQKLKDMCVGILKFEKSDLDSMRFTLTVDEDLDCSGMSIANETVCDYDEGFIAGILNEYTKKDFWVKEIDCWATGGRTCRFEVSIRS